MPYKDTSSPEAQASLRAARNRHYERNREAYKARALAAKEALKAEIREIKSKPCTDCGVSYPPYVMQFDHLGDKLENVSRLITRGARKRALEEIKKCELVCANCHAERTHQRARAVVFSSA